MELESYEALCLLLKGILGADKIILIGHSIHAFMVMEYARAFPDRVSHLVLIASSPITGLEIYKEADRYFEESVCPERKAALQITMQRFSESSDQSFVARLLSFGLAHEFGMTKISMYQSFGKA